MKSFQELKRNARLDRSSLRSVKVFLAGDTATQFLSTAIVGEGADRGLNVILEEADYNQIENQVLNPGSELHRFNPDYTVLFHSSHKLLEQYSLLAPSDWGTLAQTRLDFIRTACQSLKGKIIYFNYPEIGDSVFGSFSNKVQSSFIYQLRKLNFGLMDLAQEFPNLFICDLSELQAKYGRDNFFDSSIYINTEMILSIDSLPLVASRTMDIICSIEGKFKKCIILDLDNTLWGGVVGDDGWENIQIGHGLGIGKAFTEFQQWIKKLKNRGIIVCVCSKNDEDKAKEPFEKNPEMILKLEDFAVFVANWNNKADNIFTIQKILNIGFDSMVFIDDNPVERDIVRKNVPDILVPEMPEDPGDYLEYLYSLNIFETASFSGEDKDRTAQYQMEASRLSAAKSFANEAEFLKSLEMVCEVKPFDGYNTPRVAQLSQRSNQFNLRTVRYTEDQISEIGSNPGYKCFSFSLSDRFGDNGLICVIILKDVGEGALFCESWFMSCRVLNRGMENFTLNIIADYAKTNGYKRIIGEYLPTAKNKMVEPHFPSLGFKKIDGAATDLYELKVDTYKAKECFIKPVIIK